MKNKNADEIKALKEALSAKEREVIELKKFEALFLGINDLAYICDTAGNILFVNRELERYSGHKPEEFIGKPFGPLFDENNLKKAIDAYTTTLRGESPEYELYFKDTGILCEYKNVPFRDEKGEITGVIGIARDISYRRQTEENLRSERDKAQRYLDLAGVIFVAIDADENVTMINRKGAEVLGYAEAEILGKNWFASFVPARTREALRAAFISLISGRAGCDYYENPVLTASGEERTIAWHNTVLKSPSGEVNGSLSSGSDITDFKRAEAEVNKYRSNLEAIFRSVRDAIITIDLDFTILELNYSASRICALSRGDIGHRFNSLIMDCSKKCFETLAETFRRMGPVEAGRIECGRPGRGQTVGINAYPLVDCDGGFSGAVLVVRDETRLAVLERDLNERKQLHNIIGAAPRMQEIYSLIGDLADLTTTVLITGETGTGKELVAEAIHYGGLRSNGPLVKVNCSAIPEHLLGSELFGHVRGAFTGAVRDRIGRFELADNGTIFLDEIGDLSEETQLKLLRVLQHREFERLGDSTTMKSDVRIIAATNRDLLQRVREGRFREDLYYRLKVVEISLPPLRQRLEDLPLLVGHFISGFNKKYCKNISLISPEVQRAFMGYGWPGNIRELEHTLEHAFIVSRSETIGMEALPMYFKLPGETGQDRPIRPRKTDIGSVLSALERSAGNKSKAAGLLGISRQTLYRMLSQNRSTGR
ncbi:MAG: sigma 54-interacting transcriptional regulator [Deltaproteobacteria bacterium]|nr:sigma 54-interacting transcriptional regulator [Deltaproteobacteria bacterium]